MLEGARGGYRGQGREDHHLPGADSFGFGKLLAWGDPTGTPTLILCWVSHLTLAPTTMTMKPIDRVHTAAPFLQKPGCRRMEKVSRGANQSCPAQTGNHSYLFFSNLLVSCSTSIYQTVCPLPNCLKCYFIKYKIFIQVRCVLLIFLSIPAWNPHCFIA